VPPELKNLKGGDELSFYTALDDKKIIHSTLSELKDVLKLVMVKVGIREKNIPEDEEKSVLIDHVIRKYGGHTCQEIKLAFDMALDGKFDVEVNSYENFSCLYFSSIMNAYREWAQQVYQLIPSKVTLQLENKRDLTDADMEGWLSETASFVKDNSKVFFIPIEIYDWLISKKKLKITIEQRDFYLEQAIKMRQQQILEIDDKKSLHELTRMKREGVFEGFELYAIKNIAKKLSVFYYMNS
jgi:hypothetical protein